MFTRVRLGLIVAFVLCLVSWWALARVYRGDAIPVPQIKASVDDPYGSSELAKYKLFNDAVLVNDLANLQELASGSDYLAFQAALELSQNSALSAQDRYLYLLRASELRLVDPIDREGNRAFALRLAQAAEEAGLVSEALKHYAEALPLEEAEDAYNRLELNVFRRANAFLNASMYQEVIDALNGQLAPSLEAPAYRRLGEYEKALDAYDRWLTEIPDSFDAQLGKGWMYYTLEEYDKAQSVFATLPGNAARYAEAMANLRLGDLDRAIVLLEGTADPDYLWMATGYLEAENRFVDAIPIYMKLAQGSSKLADDAAYRAYSLANRFGFEDLKAEALSHLPDESFFAQKLGTTFRLPETQVFPSVSPPVQTLAYALARAGNHQAAIGELLFALKSASSPEEILAIAEYLQSFGEYRQSQRAVSLLFSGPSAALVRQDIRAWRLAYPRAYEAEILLETQKYNLDPFLVWAIMRQESAFFPRAVSTSKAKGLMQVVPLTWDWLAELQKEAPGNPFDAATNIRYGVFYLNWLRNYFSDFNGDQELMIASYNRGQGYIKRLFESDYVNRQKDELYREIDALETREYLQQVSLNYEVYKQLYGQ